MTGLEKILKSIEADASANAEVVIAEARKEADEITNAAKAEVLKKCAEIATKSEMDVKAVLSRAESAAELMEKKVILDAKQQIINNIIYKAKNSLANLSDSEYVGILIRMIIKYAHNKSGIIQFSMADKKRLPKDFDALLQKVLSEKEGASLTISENEADLDGGFLLIYGDIEENCSFDALFSASKEELQDKVNALLFTDETQNYVPIVE